MTRILNKKLLAHRHLRLIAKLCHQYWRSLPVHVQVVVSVDDLIGDVVVSVTRMSLRYHSGRGAETTFVQLVASSHLRNTLSSYKQKKRSANQIIPIEDWNGGITFPVQLPWQETRSGFLEMTRLISQSNSTLGQTLDKFFSERRFSIFEDAHIEELRSIVRQCRISRNEFALVLRLV